MTAIIVGACVIVWKGATSVDTKVNATETKLEGLIQQLSEKLAAYEIQMGTITNQLSKIAAQTASHPSPAPAFGVEQKARSADIYQQLNRPAQK